MTMFQKISCKAAKKEVGHCLKKLPQIRGNCRISRKSFGRNDGVEEFGKQGVATPCYLPLATVYLKKKVESGE